MRITGIGELKTGDKLQHQQAWRLFGADKEMTTALDLSCYPIVDIVKKRFFDNERFAFFVQKSSFMPLGKDTRNGNTCEIGDKADLFVCQ